MDLSDCLSWIWDVLGRYCWGCLAGGLCYGTIYWIRLSWRRRKAAPYIDDVAQKR
jgi:hypothetical protein